MTKLIVIALLALAVLALSVWALILDARGDMLKKSAIRLAQKEEMLTKHLELLEAERATLENRKKEIAEWERHVKINGKHFVYDDVNKEWKKK